jgi:hypothetical protein
VPVKIEDIEHLIDRNDPEIASDYHGWDKGNCNIVGLTALLLKQVILEEIGSRGEFYDGEFDDLLKKLPY